MSLNNNQEDNNQFFGDEFSEEQQNFDNDPAVVAATEAISSKSKGGWIVLLVGIIGTGAYLGYRYYLVPHGTTLASIEAALLPDSHAGGGNPSVPSLEKHAESKIPQPQASDAHVPDTTVSEVKVSKAPAPANTPVAETAKSTETDKAARQANKNAQFEHLRASLFDNNGETTKTTVAVPPPTPSGNKNAAAPTAAAAVAVAATKTEAPKIATAPAVSAVSRPAENTASVGDAVEQVTQLNERLEINIHQIQHLEDVLKGTTQTIAKLNTDINAMDNRLLALSNSTGNLTTDVGTIKHEMSSVKRVLGEEGALDMHVPPPPSHTYLKASQMASARPRTSIPAFVVHAIIPGRAWLKSNNGQIMTVTEGDTLGDYGKVLVIDAASGMVLTSSGNTFQ